MKQRKFYQPSPTVGFVVGGLFSLILFGSGISNIGFGHGGSATLYDVFSSPSDFGFYLRPFAFAFICSRKTRWVQIGIILLATQLCLGTYALLDGKIFSDGHGNFSMVPGSMKTDLFIYYIGHLIAMVYGVFNIKIAVNGIAIKKVPVSF